MTQKVYSELTVNGEVKETVFRGPHGVEITLTLSGGEFRCFIPASITDADLGAILSSVHRLSPRTAESLAAQKQNPPEIFSVPITWG